MIPPPSPPALARLNEHYSLGLSYTELEEFAPIVASALASSERVVEMYHEIKPEPPVRDWSKPDHNPLGAWAVETRIEGSGDGPYLNGEMVRMDGALRMGAR
jgi:amidase